MRRCALAVARALHKQQLQQGCSSSSSSSFSGFISSSPSSSCSSGAASSSGRNAATTSSSMTTSSALFRRSSSSSTSSTTSSSASRLFENVPPVAAESRGAASSRASSSGRIGGAGGGGIGGGAGGAGAGGASSSSSMHPPPLPPPPPPSSPALTAVRRALGFAALATVSAAAWLTWAKTLEEVDEMVASLEKETAPSIGGGDASSAVSDAKTATATTSAPTPSSLSSRLLLPPLRYYRDKRAAASATIASYADPPTDRLLPDLPRNAAHVRTLVLDLDGVLVKSDWRRGRGWRTFKRPGVDAFLQAASQYYELVLYTDHLPTYADPILDRLDPRRLVQYRLYRDSTRYVSPSLSLSDSSDSNSSDSNSNSSKPKSVGAQHARDLASLNRDPRRVLFVTASREAAECPTSRDNAVLIPEWGDDMDPADTGLLDLLPFLEALFRTDVPDVRPVVESYGGEPVGPAFRRRMMELEAKKGGRRGGGGSSGGSGGSGGGGGAASGGGGRFAFFRN